MRRFTLYVFSTLRVTNEFFTIIVATRDRISILVLLVGGVRYNKEDKSKYRICQSFGFKAIYIVYSANGIWHTRLIGGGEADQ